MSVSFGVNQLLTNPVPADSGIKLLGDSDTAAFSDPQYTSFSPQSTDHKGYRSLWQTDPQQPLEQPGQFNEIELNPRVVWVQIHQI